jgi:hypothetical protein
MPPLADKPPARRRQLSEAKLLINKVFVYGEKVATQLHPLAL